MLKGSKRRIDKLKKELCPEKAVSFAANLDTLDTFLFVEFLKHFEKHRIRIHEKECVLLIDGRSSHYSTETIQFSKEHGIQLFCLSSHSSQRLQPLDTRVNKVLKISCPCE